MFIIINWFIFINSFGARTHVLVNTEDFVGACFLDVVGPVFKLTEKTLSNIFSQWKKAQTLACFSSSSLLNPSLPMWKKIVDPVQPQSSTFEFLLTFEALELCPIFVEDTWPVFWIFEFYKLKTRSTNLRSDEILVWKLGWTLNIENTISITKRRDFLLCICRRSWNSTES